MKDYKRQIEDYLKLEIEVLKKLNIEEIDRVLNVLETARNNGKQIYIFGNGGSASTASHFSCDFNKGVSEHLEKKYRFVCLNDNVPTLMAIANDIGYDRIFDIQMHGKLEEGDLVIAISGSGNSSNVVNAVKYAKELGILVIGITGYTGGLVDELADYHLHVPILNMQIAEDIHMIFEHLMMWILTYGE